jgi:hypothetical protein
MPRVSCLESLVEHASELHVERLADRQRRRLRETRRLGRRVERDEVEVESARLLRASAIEEAVASAFCGAPITRSAPHVSIDTGVAPSEVTASTISTVSDSGRSSRRRLSIGASVPVLVSACTSVTASTGGPSSIAASIPASSAAPSGTWSRTTSLSQASATRAKRWPNAPPTTHSTRSRTPARTAASIIPVALQVARATGRRTPRTARSRAWSEAASASPSGRRWPIIGRARAAAVSGWSSTGPGSQNRPETLTT